MATVRDYLSDEQIESLHTRGYSNEDIYKIVKDIHRFKTYPLAEDHDKLVKSYSGVDVMSSFKQGLLNDLAVKGSWFDELVNTETNPKYKEHIERYGGDNGKTTIPSEMNKYGEYSFVDTPPISITKSSKFTNYAKQRSEDYERAQESSEDITEEGRSIWGHIAKILGGSITNPTPSKTMSLAGRVVANAVIGASNGAGFAYVMDEDGEDIAAAGLTGAVGSVIFGEALRGAGKAAGKASQGFKNFSTKSNIAANVNNFLDKNHLSSNVKEEVLKEIAKGETKSKFISQSLYEKARGINEIGGYIGALVNNPKITQNVIKVEKELAEEVAKVKDHSFAAWSEFSKQFAKEMKANPNLTNSQILRIVDTKIKPTPQELKITSWINDGTLVENRLSGNRILLALEQTIKTNKTTPNKLFASLKNSGFSDEASSVFVQSYEKGNINIAKQWFEAKVQKGMVNEVRVNSNIDSELMKGMRAIRGIVDGKSNVELERTGRVPKNNEQSRQVRKNRPAEHVVREDELYRRNIKNRANPEHIAIKEPTTKRKVEFERKWKELRQEIQKLQEAIVEAKNGKEFEAIKTKLEYLKEQQKAFERNFIDENGG